MKKLDTSLYLITDSTGLDEEEFLRRVSLALQGGVTLLQLREKEKTTREYINLAKKVGRLASRYNVPLIIDDRVDVCLAANAQGVHLGAEDMQISDARRLLGDGFIIGATAKTVAAAQDAQKSGADYLGVGAISPTTTKVKTVFTPIETLKDICASVSIPVNAIGGLNKENLSVLRDIDIDGICVVSAIMKAEDPFTEAQILRNRRSL